MIGLTPAERVLQELGISEPTEIDLEAIAFHLGACVRFRRLEGCEARIIGCNDTAIITGATACATERLDRNAIQTRGDFGSRISRRCEADLSANEVRRCMLCPAILSISVRR